MKFDWGEEEDLFQKLKEAITEAPLLVFLKEDVVDLYWILMLQIKL